MKNSILFFLILIACQNLSSQTVQATSLGELTNKAYTRPGIYPGWHNFNGMGGNGYESEFDAKGNITGKKSFSLNINDVALTKGFLEFDKVLGADREEGFNYIDYASATSKYVDIFKITNTSKGQLISILRQQVVMDHFVAYNGEKFFMINENLEITKEYKAKYSYPYDNLFEVFQDGCIYYLSKDKNEITIRKVDLVNEKELELKVSVSSTYDIIEPNMYIYSFLDPGEYRLSISPDGSKAFLGFFPGKANYDQNRGIYVNRSSKGRFIVFDNTTFTISFDQMFDIPEDYQMEATGSDKGVTSPNIEDVEFKGEDIIVSTSSKANWGVDPIAIYKVSPGQKKVVLDGIITNKHDDALARDRQASQIFTMNNKVYLIYFSFLTDDDKYKTVNKTYPTLHIVNITSSNYDHKIYKDELTALNKSKIYPYNYSMLENNSILLMAATLGISVYENLYAVKVTFE